MGKVHEMPTPEPTERIDPMAVDEWIWSDFRDTWNALSEKYDADTAWQFLYSIWQVRAGEITGED